MNREQVYAAIDGERIHQDAKWGAGKEQSLPGFLLIIRKELEEAEIGWMKNEHGRDSALCEIVQIAATCVACLEKYGVMGSAIATDDIPVPERKSLY